MNSLVRRINKVSRRKELIQERQHDIDNMANATILRLKVLESRLLTLNEMAKPPPATTNFLRKTEQVSAGFCCCSYANNEFSETSAMYINDARSQPYYYGHRRRNAADLGGACKARVSKRRASY